MKSMVKDKFSKNNQAEKAKNGGSGDEEVKRANVGRRTSVNSGKRRASVNNFQSKGGKEEEEVNEEEEAALLEKQTIGLNTNPVISQVLRSKEGMTTVRVKMEFPFKMKDVWRELVQSKCPLDIDDEKMQSIERIRPSHERKPGMGAGYIRKVIYKNKTQTLHELVECVEPKLIKWRVLDAKGLPFMLRGKRASPECTIELHPDGLGTDIEVTYTFEYATIIFPLCCFAPLVAYGIRYVLVKNLQAAWTDMMLDRGYNDRYEEMATRMQAWTKSMAERRFHRIKVGAATKADNDDDDDDETPRQTPSKKAASQPPPRHTAPPPRKPPGGATAAKPKPAPKAAAKAITTFTRSRVVESDDESESDDDIKKVDTTISPETLRPDSPEPATSTVKILDDDDDDDESEEPPKKQEASVSRPPAKPPAKPPTKPTNGALSASGDSHAANGCARKLPSAGPLPPPPEGTPRLSTATLPPASSTTSGPAASAPVSDSRPSRPEAAPKTQPLQDPNTSLLDA